MTHVFVALAHMSPSDYHSTGSWDIGDCVTPRSTIHAMPNGTQCRIRKHTKCWRSNQILAFFCVVNVLLRSSNAPISFISLLCTARNDLINSLAALSTCLLPMSLSNFSGVDRISSLIYPPVSIYTLQSFFMSLTWIPTDWAFPCVVHSCSTCWEDLCAFPKVRLCIL